MEKKITGYPSIDRPWEKGVPLAKRRPIIPKMSIYSLLKLICLRCMDHCAVEYKDFSVS